MIETTRHPTSMVDGGLYERPRSHAFYRPFRALYYASWLYPFKGIVYFLAHPALYPLLGARMVPIILISTFVLVTLFFWAYLPTVAVLAVFHGPLAWFQAAMLLLGVGAAITALLFEGFFVDETLVDLFDVVLVDAGLADLVERSRPVQPRDQATTLVKSLGRPQVSAVYSPFSLRQIVEFVLLLPLNFIPIVGTIIFLVLTGYRAGPLHHWRYFQLLGLAKQQRKMAERQRRFAYTCFGTAALVLQLVPVLSMLFLLTTACGSALWVVRIETDRRIAESEEVAEGTNRYRDPVDAS